MAGTADVAYDHAPLGHGVEAMRRHTVAPHALAETGRAVAACREVRFAGGDHRRGETRSSRCRAVPPRTGTRT
ncbi:hypothetical protein GCM10010106_12960 [Thermopolyspora flexuosa]|nr:hypothetical protein GCM10010106_12960 [Thermopolyspora flexuosa]